VDGDGLADPHLHANLAHRRGSDPSAQQLATLPAVMGVSGLKQALAALGLARRDTRAAWSAALGAARAAAWTPSAAGQAAAREAAWRSAGAAAWAAARVAVGDIPGNRARAIAREIAGDAAAAVTREARASVDRASAPAAAREALAPHAKSCNGQSSNCWTECCPPGRSCLRSSAMPIMCASELHWAHSWPLRPATMPWSSWVRRLGVLSPL
jgi:hypothetical protein